MYLYRAKHFYTGKIKNLHKIRKQNIQFLQNSENNQYLGKLYYFYYVVVVKKYISIFVRYLAKPVLNDEFQNI